MPRKRLTQEIVNKRFADRGIAGVATSVAAFVGWSARGDMDKPTLVKSWPDFEQKCGGLDTRSLLGYSVYHFFNNGGHQAHIVRLMEDDAGTAGVTIDGKLRLVARNPGNWSKDYAIATKIRADDPNRFRLAVIFVPPGTAQEIVVEAFDNLSLSPNDRRDVVKLIEEQSAIVKAKIVAGATTLPADTALPSPRLTGDANLDGTVLDPNTERFEAKLQAGGGATGVNLLYRVDIFNLLCVPGETTPAQISLLQKFCRDRRAFMIADCDQGATFGSLQNGPNNVLTGENAINASFYFPWVNAPDPRKENRLREFPPCGFVAGLFAKTDATRGVWKAPAGIDASLVGAAGVKTDLTDLENGTLNIHAINCLRKFSVHGNVVWGARTLRGNNELGSEWKYVPIRRLALYIKESLYRGTKWVVFEPNDEPLWAQIRLNVGSFMQDHFRQGAFQGSSPRQAYFVKCDGETTTETDRNLGVVNILVGFAPLKPAEFVVIKIQQMAGQTEA